MKQWKHIIELKLVHLVETIHHYPERFILAVVVFTLLMATQLWFVRFDTSTESFLSDQDPDILALNASREQYGRSDFILLTIRSDEIFSFEFLTRLQTLQDDLENHVSWVDDVDSLLTARETRGTSDGFVVGDYFDPYPETQQQLDVIRKKIVADPLLQDLVISDDGYYTTMTIRPVTYDIDEHAVPSDAFDDMAFSSDMTELMDTAVERPLLPAAKLDAMVDQVAAVIEPYRQQGMEVYMGGMPVVSHGLTRSMIREMLLFMPLAMITIVIFLGLLFRRREGVQFPMVVVLLTMLTLAGLICMLRVPIMLPMMIVPTFILTVTIGDAVHFMSIFFDYYDQGMEKLEALKRTMRLTAIPIILTSLTTAAGLLSFVGAPIIPLSYLGFFSAIGVVIALSYSLILIPALISRFDIKRKSIPAVSNHTVIARFINWHIRTSIRFPVTIMVIAVGFFLLAGWGIRQLEFSHNPLKWLPKNMEARHAIETIDEHMGGSIPVEIIIDTGVVNGLYNPDVLHQMDAAVTWLEHYKTRDFAVAKVSGLTYVIKESNQALHNGDPAEYLIPDDRAVIANELFIFENSGADELKRIVDSQFQQTRMVVIMPWIDTTLYRPFQDEISARLQQQFEGLATVGITGVAPVLGKTLYSVIRTTARSYAIAFAVIAIMLMIMLSSIRLGLIAMIPNLLPIVCMMGLMHYLDIPLDMFTILVASIAIGIAVDDTVHFMHHFREYYSNGHDVRDAITRTLHTSGKAMLTTSIVLCCGFGTLLASSMLNVRNFGLLISITIALALIADFLLSPALMMRLYDNKKL
ncbi:efflux RND transporter permease subunit [Gynuella sp.]|uniref:efflux RND transporter permease subunit n=1 Tax=Gynuella sp. TaxID=2969146 RepID=UPI003D0981C4